MFKKYTFFNIVIKILVLHDEFLVLCLSEVLEHLNAEQ